MTIANINSNPRNMSDLFRNWQQLAAYLIRAAGGITVGTDGSLTVAVLAPVVLESNKITVADYGSRNFLAGPVSGANAKPTARRILTTDLAVAPAVNALLTSNTDGSMNWAAPALTVLNGATSFFSISGSPVSLPGTVTLGLSSAATFSGSLSVTGTLTVGGNTVVGYNFTSGAVTSGSAIALSTGTIANVGTLSLAPGIWDVTGTMKFQATGASATAFKAGMSTTSATFGGDNSQNNTPLVTTTLSDVLGVTLPLWQMDSRTAGSNTTVYYLAQATFTVGTVSAYGTFRALRVG